MNDRIKIIKIKKNPQMIEMASQWFHQKWNIPAEAYLESMEESVSNEIAIPAWYLAVDGDCVIGGLGVIENDFHDRKDLTPNICAVYVEKEYRCHGLAGELLETACKDMKSYGIHELYLITGHTGFYEKYGWKFFCMVHCDGDVEPSRMYKKTI
ncbi:MAG: GNAT family N-acetyltransferase [Lachnospiraceae bacterium]|nr:GNAT family N-acetyltransferase [Lachnospiraceae bacterium]